MKPRIRQIISGGQSGVDRGALDAAVYTDTPMGGWCPAGRWAEDGPIPEAYPLQETESADPAVRTEANVKESDATLLVTWGPPAGGSQTTWDCCRRHGKPRLHLDMSQHTRGSAVRAIRQWLEGREQLDLMEPSPAGPVPPHCRLNVAGARESEAPGAHNAAKQILVAVLVGEAPPPAAREAGEQPHRRLPGFEF